MLIAWYLSDMYLQNTRDIVGQINNVINKDYYIVNWEHVWAV